MSLRVRIPRTPGSSVPSPTPKGHIDEVHHEQPACQTRTYEGVNTAGAPSGLFNSRCGAAGAFVWLVAERSGAPAPKPSTPPEADRSAPPPATPQIPDLGMALDAP